MFLRFEYLKICYTRGKNFIQVFRKTLFCALFAVAYCVNSYYVDTADFSRGKSSKNTVVSRAITQLIPRSCTQLHLEMNASIVIISISQENMRLLLQAVNWTTSSFLPFFREWLKEIQRCVSRIATASGDATN